MSDSSQQAYKLVEAVREHWADIMLHALRENGHVYLGTDEWYALKGELMQLLIGKVRI